jgi:small subunit ribosomal protein S5
MSDEVTTNNSVADTTAVETTQVVDTSTSDAKVETKPGFHSPRNGVPKIGTHSRNDRHYAPRREGERSSAPATNSDGTPVAPGSRPAFGGNRRTFGVNRPGQSGPASGGRTGGGFGGGFKKNDRRKKEQSKDQLPEGYEAKVILIRRVTRVVKGGKRMRFSALVVVGDREGKIGYGLKKGADFQDSVAKATKSAQNAMFKINFDQNKSVSFPSDTKHKSCEIFLKPAHSGTGLIAGGFIRPVLELAGIQNIYSKINRSRNKIVGVQCVLKALQKYSVK